MANVSPPPDYSPPMTATEANYGFPHGYFVIRSCATGRLLDVEHDSVSDSAELILWPEKETSLVDGALMSSCFVQLWDADVKCLRVQEARSRQPGNSAHTLG